MKLIRPSYAFLPQEEGLNGVFKQIELAGRTCYKSEDKITDDSAIAFVDKIVKIGHGAMLEHGTVYLKFTHTSGWRNSVKYIENKYSFVNTQTIPPTNSTLSYDIRFVTTNYRVLVENG